MITSESFDKLLQTVISWFYCEKFEYKSKFIKSLIYYGKMHALVEQNSTKVNLSVQEVYFQCLIRGNKYKSEEYLREHMTDLEN